MPIANDVILVLVKALASTNSKMRQPGVAPVFRAQCYMETILISSLIGQKAVGVVSEQR